MQRIFAHVGGDGVVMAEEDGGPAQRAVVDGLVVGGVLRVDRCG